MESTTLGFILLGVLVLVVGFFALASSRIRSSRDDGRHFAGASTAVVGDACDAGSASGSCGSGGGDGGGGGGSS